MTQLTPAERDALIKVARLRMSDLLERIDLLADDALRRLHTEVCAAWDAATRYIYDEEAGQ